MEVFGLYGKIYLYGFGLLAVRVHRMGAYHKLLELGLNKLIKTGKESIFTFGPNRIKEVAAVIKVKKQDREIEALKELSTTGPPLSGNVVNSCWFNSL